METTQNIALELKITRQKIFVAVTCLFLAWHPAFLGSENLTLTTYYPAPYGGYVSILTTGNTYLARDVNGSSVNIGENTAAGIKLNVNGDVKWGSYGYLTTDQNGSLEIGQSGAGDMPYVDFHGAGDTQTNYQDYSARLILNAPKQLRLDGSLYLTGTLKNVCQAWTYGVNSWTPCPSGFPTAIAFYPTSSGYVEGNILSYAALNAGSGWWSLWSYAFDNKLRWFPVGGDWAGKMICCRIDLPSMP